MGAPTTRTPPSLSSPNAADVHPVPSDAALEKAIDVTPIAPLRAMIKKLYRESDEVHLLVRRLLIAPTSVPVAGVDGRKRKAGSLEREDADAAGAGSKKLKETGQAKEEARYQMCVNCDEPFDLTRNHEKACQYHDGYHEPDFEGDFWADHDERCHGIIDTEEMFKEYPEGFIWTCCEKPGDAPGCQFDCHRAA